MNHAFSLQARLERSLFILSLHVGTTECAQYNVLELDHDSRHAEKLTHGRRLDGRVVFALFLGDCVVLSH